MKFTLLSLTLLKSIGIASLFLSTEPRPQYPCIIGATKQIVKGERILYSNVKMHAPGQLNSFSLRDVLIPYKLKLWVGGQGDGPPTSTAYGFRHVKTLVIQTM